MLMIINPKTPSPAEPPELAQSSLDADSKERETGSLRSRKAVKLLEQAPPLSTYPY